MDKVKKPEHYIGIDGLEVEEVLRNFIPKYTDGYAAHRVSSAVEYLLRSPGKNGLEDIKKARQNLDQLIAYEESKQEEVTDNLLFFLKGLAEVGEQNRINSEE